MWGRLESRYPSLESRVKSLGLRVDADLSSIIEENTPESKGGAGSGYLVSTCLKLCMEVGGGLKRLAVHHRVVHHMS